MLYDESLVSNAINEKEDLFLLATLNSMDHTTLIEHISTLHWYKQHHLRNIELYKPGAFAVTNNLFEYEHQQYCAKIYKYHKEKIISIEKQIQLAMAFA